MTRKTLNRLTAIQTSTSIVIVQYLAMEQKEAARAGRGPQRRRTQTIKVWGLGDWGIYTLETYT